MTEKYFVEYNGIEVKHFRDTLLQHMGNIKKSVFERACHQRQYDRRVNKRLMQTQESQGMIQMLIMQISDPPIYDEEPMAKVANFRKENKTLKKHYKDLYDSIKITRSRTIEQTTSLLANNANLKAQIQEKVFAIAALKNDLWKLKRNSVDTKFAKTSVLGKPVLRPLRNQSVVRKPNACKHERLPMSKQRFASQVDVNHNVSKLVTQHYLPKKSESAFAKPDHMIASSSSRNSSKNMPRFSSNDMVYIHYLDEAKKKNKREIGTQNLVKPPHGSNVDISKIHEYKQTLDLSAGTSINVSKEQSLDVSAGIQHQTSVARTPEQNGVVERWNRTLVEAARTMLSATKVPLFFWAEAIATVCFTQNHSLVIPRHEKIPYHIINDRKPSVKFFHVFSSLCYIVRDGKNLDKKKEKGDECIFVGYSTQSKAYRVFNKRTRVIMESIHVNFDELPQMALDQNSSDPAPECQIMALNHDSLSPTIQCQEKVTQADRTVTRPNELDLLFSPMLDELLNESSKVVSKSSAVSVADALNQRQQLITLLNNHTTPIPTLIPRHEKTPYHIINDRKPSIKFFHIFGSVCYIVRDGENLNKMKEKGDECIFVGYSTQSRAYRVFNKRTRVIMESIHVNFDELPQMASAHNSSDSAPTCQTMASVQISSDPAPECQTMVLNHNSLSPGRKCQENVSHGDKIASAPTCQTPPITTSVISSENINQAEPHAEHDEVADDEFINIFLTPVQDQGETSSRHVDSS
nr:retrovirus-related Pol polyprotein from transposon TNT 1-94 [Tanacetum cinerariifolium]